MEVTMSKQTAVEWFWNNLTDDMIGDLSPEQIGSIYKLMEQAKQMEKEQIVDGWLNGMKGEMIAPLSINNYKPEAEEYFNETYGGEE